MTAESDRLPSGPDREPTRALLLAQALETCIEAERRIPGSADYVIARQPEWARAEAFIATKQRWARGDYVTHLDDDDEYLPQRLEVLVQYARARGCDFVWHPFWYRRDDSPEWH